MLFLKSWITFTEQLHHFRSKAVFLSSKMLTACIRGQNESVMGAMNVEQHIPAGVDV